MNEKYEIFLEMVLGLSLVIIGTVGAYPDIIHLLYGLILATGTAYISTITYLRLRVVVREVEGNE